MLLVITGPWLGRGRPGERGRGDKRSRLRAKRIREGVGSRGSSAPKRESREAIAAEESFGLLTALSPGQDGGHTAGPPNPEISIYNCAWSKGKEKSPAQLNALFIFLTGSFVLSKAI